MIDQIQVVISEPEPIVATIVQSEGLLFRIIELQDMNVQIAEAEPIEALIAAEAPIQVKIDPYVHISTQGDNLVARAKAGETLGGQRVVRIESGLLFYASKDVLAHAHSVFGVTTGAIIADDTGSVVLDGVMQEPSWTWSPGLPLFLSTNGLLTQTPPAAGFLIPIGKALTPTKILIRIDEPIILS